MKTNTWRGKTAQKKAFCPNCGKRGMGHYKPNPHGHKPMLQRTCRYCGYIETEITN